MHTENISRLLCQMYDEQRAGTIGPRVLALIEQYCGRIPVPNQTELTEKDAMLITYGDHILSADSNPLQTLTRVCESHLKGLISSIHILPFFPWSSDDGFSVKDYRQVDPALGTWDDIEKLGQSFRLMFDGVINHMSAESDWFQYFLKNEEPYNRYFLTVDGNPSLSDVIRPRALPLLTEFDTIKGPRKVWTTFSADQVDLDFHNPDVLLEILDILLEYALRGAQFIRLDAIAYLWKEIGTTCLHLPQTHAFIQLLRVVLDETAPHVRIITETNVPHEDNVSYFGDGTNEAQLVYNFALPPLVLHTLLTGDSTALSNWAHNLEYPTDQTTYFNFLASHDGIGLNPARGILTDAEIENLVKHTTDHGGLISYKNNPDGSQSPYEMNINYFDALSDPVGNEPLQLQVDRFMAAQAIMLMLRGVPGIYFHSLFGSRGWRAGVEQTGQNRTINRQKLEFSSFHKELSDSENLRYRVFSRYSRLLHLRSQSTAFHPNGSQEILDMGPGLFALSRISPDGSSSALFIQNVTPYPQLIYQTELQPYETRLTLK